MAEHLNVFDRKILDKISEICDARYNNNELRLNEIKKLYSLLLTGEGRELLHRDDSFRIVTEQKVTEWINNPISESQTQFLALSRSLLRVIYNIKMLKN